jgi:hypothetical protein
MKMKMLLTMTQSTVKLALALIITIFVLGTITVSNAQVQSGKAVTSQEQGKTFQSIGDGFSIAVPEDWVIEDVHNTDTDALLEEMQQGSRLLARLCPQEQAFADADDAYSCEDADSSIYIQQYPNLADEPEFASIANSNITNENFLSYHMVKLQKLGYTNSSILQEINMNINVTSADTNNTIAIVPANFIEMRYNSADSQDTRGYFLLAATNATSKAGIISGYSVSYEGEATTLPSGNLAEIIEQIFQSFEFVKEERAGRSAVQDENASYYENPAAAAADITGRPT